MFFTSNTSWKEKGTRTVELKCNHCGNTEENYVAGELDGLNMGFIFMPKKYWLGKRTYFLACPICGYANKELSRTEIESLRSSY